MIQIGSVRECTTFDITRHQRLKYALVSDANISAVAATFEDGHVVVRVPTDQVVAWGMTDQVGIHATQMASDGTVLRILIEKDLECIDAPVEESQEDAFPRPDQGVACSSTTMPATLVADGLS
jgi:hypothetical protein